MAVYDRSTRGRPNLWLSYALTPALAARWGLASRTVREPAGTGDKRAAAALLAQRRREVREGTWRPRTAGRGQTAREYGEQWLSARERSGLRTADRERQRLRDYAWPVLGDVLLGEVRRAHVLDAITRAGRHVSTRTGRPLAPRTVRHLYADLRAMFADALADELILASPCTLRERRGELPAKRDADPAWRGRAVFSRDELERLISDERIPDVRRVQWALCGLGGLRIGEAVARTWGDYDARAEPLGRLHVHSQHDGRATKTEAPREVPVHPVLARVLAAWRLGGAPLLTGRAPRAEDLILPRSHGRAGPRDGRRAWLDLQRDLETLGLRPRRVHDLRRTFVSMARADGARGELLRWVSHGRAATVLDSYTTPEWAALCEQVACLQVEIRGAQPATQLTAKPRFSRAK